MTCPCKVGDATLTAVLPLELDLILLGYTQIRAQDENAGPLYGCVLCVSCDGTIAVATLDEFQFLFIIPASASSLAHTYYGGGMEHEQLMVTYTDGTARLWDVKAREFRRAMDQQKVQDSLARFVWQEITFEGQVSTFFAEYPAQSGGAPRATVQEDCQTVIAFYATSLATAVGRSYQPPDLVWLARQWFDTMNEMRQAAKVLVDAGVARLNDDESISLVGTWQSYLEKYVLLSDSTLRDIAASIVSYLHQDDPTRRVLAVDLCARGFQIWQYHVDAMGLLRSLYSLAVSSRKDAISIQNVGQQARQAVLQIASSNATLFMTTLTLDILNPISLEHRKIVMQLVAFLIRKKPLLLYPNLARLMEAVVKSLDPNSTSSRDAVHDTATEIIGHVVKTFPTVDFHMTSQRLAVGTCEGAFIMYDLKTATQLYVLDSHKRQATACSFSPDGRRLVTVSLEEGVVLVWKVGSSFTSFFIPGAPPRQGHSGSQPYKTLSFNVGDEAKMTVAGTLEWVKFEWPSERAVRLHIRDSTLTFST
ncbi:hypothetical protein ID866_2221 [Astraeus odoratus]|nr:hypothetical protein ID866_2221 [Astraeus odoratus]